MFPSKCRKINTLGVAMPYSKSQKEKLEIFGGILRQRRLAAHKTIREVCYNAGGGGKDSAILQRIETAKTNPSLLVMLDIATGLNIPLSQLILEFELATSDHQVIK